MKLPVNGTWPPEFVLRPAPDSRPQLLRSLAGAVYAAVLRADTAGLEESLPKRTARSEETDPRVVGRDPSPCGGGRDLLAFQIDLANELGILRTERWDQIGYAGADLQFQFRLKLLSAGFLELEPLQCSFLGSRTSVVVDDRVAKQTKEPGHSPARIPQRLLPLEPSQVRALQDVSRDLTTAHALLEETQEPVLAIHQDLNRHRWTGLCPFNHHFDAPRRVSRALSVTSKPTARSSVPPAR